MEFRCEHALLQTLYNNCEVIDAYMKEDSEKTEIIVLPKLGF
jgi:hypothetical protein